MAIKGHSLEMRGMPRRELEEYFLTLGGKRVGLQVYLGPNWEVRLSDEWISIQVPATQVTFWVDEEDWTKLVKVFRFCFLSAEGYRELGVKNMGVSDETEEVGDLFGTGAWRCFVHYLLHTDSYFP